MMNPNPSHACHERGEFYGCLARAFLTPWRADDFVGLRDALPEDLAELGGSLGYELAPELASYRQAMAAIPDHQALLQHYSALFVAPPRPVQINIGSYIDRALNGATVTVLEALYRSCGMARSAHFHDLADHLAVQLEFAAMLFFRQAQAQEREQEQGEEALPAIRAEHFLHDFVARGLSPFIGDLESYLAGETRANDPYLSLARILRLAVARDGVARELPAGQLRAQRAISLARHRRAERGVTAEDMAMIAAKLAEKGLTTDHLAIAPERRDAAQGLTRKRPPSVRCAR